MPGRRCSSVSRSRRRRRRRKNSRKTMSIKDKTLKLCSCNKTIALDAQALASALKTGTPLPIHTELCRKEAGQFQAALGEESLLVGCTQEAPLFGELAEAAGSKAELRFVNIREMAGWSAEGRQATPKIAALLAAAALPEPEPVPNVEYKSGGQILVIGPSAVALEWAKRFSTHLQPSVLITSQEGGELPAERSFPVWSGKPLRVSGWLGAFEVEWQQENPIDLEVCTRCNKCIDVCPESAIDFSYQIDLGKCKAHRQCVAACGEIGAVDFSRAERARKESFDLVLDLSTEPLLRVPDLPQGYLAPGADPLAQALAAAKLTQLVGEFEKPRFFAYREKICAHARSGIEGCNRCLEVCSTGAIRFEVFHVASIGLDTLLGAICYGASQVVVVSTKESEHYAAALREQMALGEVILNALGFEGSHFFLFYGNALEKELWALKPATGVPKTATFNLSPEKRTTLDFELDHLASNASQKVEEIKLPAGAPFGALLVNKQTCTLCKACIGACPESALLDAADAPRLRFIERNCVQCGLCAETCPEDAIELVPRLLFGPQAKQAVTLNEAEPFHCVRCGKPFGTRRMVDSMLGKLGGHSMFAGDGALRRLQMCGDCRVVDMMENRAEATIFDFKK